MVKQAFLAMLVNLSILTHGACFSNSFASQVGEERSQHVNRDQLLRRAAKTEKYKIQHLHLNDKIAFYHDRQAVINDAFNMAMEFSHTRYLLPSDVPTGVIQLGITTGPLDFGYVAGTSVKVDDPKHALSNARAINDAMALAASRGGGTVQLPCGRIYVGATIDNVYSRVFVRGCGPDIYHDAGAPSYGTILLPTFAGTVLRHRTVPSKTHSRNTGGGYVDLTVEGNSIATRLLHVTSISLGEYHVYLKDSVGHEAALFDSLETGKNLAEAADTQFNDIRLFIRQIDGDSARHANGVVFDGSKNANFSGNKNVVLQVQHVYGDAVVCKNADNNSISIGAFRSNGLGKTLLGYGMSSKTGCYSNIFSTISGRGAIYMRGTSDGDKGGVSNQIAWLDTANGAPVPSAGIGSSWTWTESNNGILFEMKGVHAIIGSKSGEMINSIASRRDTTSLDIVNDSQDGVRIRTSDNSVSWGISTVDQNLRVAQLAGTGGVLETKQIKLHGQSVNSLPKCNAEYAGTLTSVYDAREGNFNSILVAGGRSRSLALCDGEEWRMH